MTIPTTQMSVDTFDEWIFLPENDGLSYEYIGGEIVEVVSNNYSSKIAFEIGFHIRLFMKENNLEGHITGADGGYVIAGERYIPDVAYISSARQEKPSHEAYNSNHPDLAIEVMSPSDSDRNLRIKVANYLSVGTMVWVVRPDKKQIEVYVAGEKVRILNKKDKLDGGAVLKGFSLIVGDIFSEDVS
ncbi:MAG: Uma2 family endonuclease [Chloroflexota bacterium]